MQYIVESVFCILNKHGFLIVLAGESQTKRLFLILSVCIQTIKYQYFNDGKY